MAAVATNGTGASTPNLPEEVSKPPEGVVLPPKDIRGELSTRRLKTVAQKAYTDDFLPYSYC